MGQFTERAGTITTLLLALCLQGCIQGRIQDASLAAPIIENSIEQLITNDQLSLSGTCKANLTVEITGEDLTPQNIPCDSNGHFQTQLSFSGSDGNKAVTVKQTDAYGNVGLSTASIVYDKTPPSESPGFQNWLGGESNNVNTRTINLTVTDPKVEVYKYVITSAANCSNEGANLTAASERLISQSFDLSPLTEGTYKVCAILKDTAGNWQSTPTESNTLNIDLTPPAVSVTSHANGQAVETSLTLSGGCELGSSNLTITGSFNESPATAVCLAGSYSLPIHLNGTDGDKPISITQTDLATNTTTITHHLTLDTTPPVVTISSTSNGAIIDPYGLTVSGSCTFGDTLSVGGTIAEAGDVLACLANGTYTTQVNFTQDGEAQTLSVNQIDSVGHTASVTYNLTADPPVFTFIGARPSLVGRALSCSMCHAKIQGDIVTDFGHGNSFFLAANYDAATNPWVRPYEGGIFAEDWREKTQITGNVYTKNVNISSVTAYVDALNTANGAGVWKLIDVVTKNMYSTLRTATVKLLNFIGVAPTDAAPGFFGNAYEKNIVTIKAPTSAQLLGLAASMTQISSSGGVTIYKKTNATLTNLNVVAGAGGNYVRNNAGTIDCWGDIIINGPLFLDNLSINSRAAGCRIYATGTIFIRGPITYANEATFPKANLQLSSSRAIISGFNPLSVWERFGATSTWVKVPTSVAPDDASAIANGQAINSEASRIPDLDNDAGPMMRMQLANYSGPGVIGSYTPVGYKMNEVDTVGNEPARAAAGDAQWIPLPGQNATFNAIRGNCGTSEAELLANNWNCLITWANETNRKTINYKKLILNAPLVHGRYYGVFEGIVIAEFFMPAVQHLEYKYDPTFESVPILPLIITDIYKLQD